MISFKFSHKQPEATNKNSCSQRDWPSFINLSIFFTNILFFTLCNSVSVRLCVLYLLPGRQRMSAEWCPVRVRIGGADRETHNAKLNLMFLFNLAVRINLQSFSEGQNQAAEDTSAASSVSPPYPPPPPHREVSPRSGKKQHTRLKTPTPPWNTLGRP